MDIQRFAAQAQLHQAQAQDKSSTRPLSQSTALLEPMQQTTTLLAQLLDVAVGCMEPGELYCEIGCLPGANLVAALLHHPDCMAYGVADSVSLGAQPDAIAQLAETLTTAGLDERVFFCSQSFEEFFNDLQQMASDDRMGVYVYNEKTDYRSVILGLMLATQFLSERALMIVNQADLRTVRQAAWDFLASYTQANLLLDLAVNCDGAGAIQDNFLVLSWDATKRTELHRFDWQNNRDRAVIDAIYQLPASQPLDLEALRKEAVQLHVEGRLSEAENRYRTMLQFDAQNPEIWLNLGMLCYLTENNAAAIDALQQSLTINSENALAHHITGLTLERMARVGEAVAAYQQAIALDETNVDTLDRLGNLLMQNGELKQAEALFRRAIALQPKAFAGYDSLGNVLMEQHQAEAAIAAYHQALMLKQRDPDILRKLGEAYAAFGDLANAHNFFAYAYSRAGNPEAAIEAFQAFFAIAETATAYDYLTLGDCYQLCGQTEAAIETFRAAANLQPEDQFLQVLPQLTLSLLYQTANEIADYYQQFEEGLQTLRHQIELADACYEKIDFKNFYCLRTFYLPYQAINVRELQAIYGQLFHRAMREQYPQWVAPVAMPPVNQPDKKTGKIRIGYLADSLGTNSMTRWAAGWLKQHDRDQFEIYCYNTGSASSQRTEHFKALSDFYHYIPYALEAVAQQILADELHILVFLAIGTNTLTSKLASLRLAPVQCSAWGHPVTSGMPTIEYYLSGALMEPEDAQDHYTEQLIRLPKLGFSYPQPIIPEPTKKRTDFGLKADAVLYVSCQLTFKYLPQHDYLFVEIARRVPRAQFVFILRSTLTHGSSTNLERQFRDRLQRAFAAVGLHSDAYCVFLPSQNWQDYTSLLLDADVFLDTLEFSGGHTTFDAIACNLPVVTHVGTFMRGRQSCGMLTTLGVPETIAQTEAEYIELAVRLGLEPEWKRAIAQRISERHHHLFDDTDCVAGLEQFYQQVVAAKLAQQAAATLSTSIQQAIPTATKAILHVGCGPYNPNALPESLRTPEWREVRLDINPDVNPDIIGSITDMSAVLDESVEAVFSSHNLEHLYAHDVPLALSEFYRVLKPGGFVLITLPDIQAVAEHVAQGRLEEPLYVSPAGPIAAIDILYGLRTAIAAGNHFMAHRTAFTAQSLQAKLQQAGFSNIESHKEGLNLWQRGYK